MASNGKQLERLTIRRRQPKAEKAGLPDEAQDRSVPGDPEYLPEDPVESRFASETGPRRRRLLVVDDSQLVLELIHDFFVWHGYDVDGAVSAEEALELLEQVVPDVIVTDVLMPGMDGWAFYEEVKDRPTLEEVPFVFLTNEIELPERIRGLSAGAEDYMSKPFRVEDLYSRVERLLLPEGERTRSKLDDGAFLAGSAEHLAMPDLLQVLSLNGKDAVVLAQQGGEEGEIVFEAGNIAHAACGPVSGLKALYRMLGWFSASFRVLPREEDVEERTVQISMPRVLIDGLVSLDEWNRWRPLLPPSDACLELTPDAESRLLEHEAVPAELDVMAQVKEGFEVGEILDRSSLPDVELAEALHTLLRRGVLRTRE